MIKKTLRRDITHTKKNHKLPPWNGQLAKGPTGVHKPGLWSAPTTKSARHDDTARSKISSPDSLKRDHPTPVADNKCVLKYFIKGPYLHYLSQSGSGETSGKQFKKLSTVAIVFTVK